MGQCQLERFDINALKKQKGANYKQLAPFKCGCVSWRD